jgi:hypothetical protein
VNKDDLIKYRIFPKLDGNILHDKAFVSQIKLPIKKPKKPLKEGEDEDEATLEKPLKEYSNENISSMVWLA